MKRLIVGTFSFLILSLGLIVIPSPAYAVDKQHDLVEGTFPVRDVLRLPPTIDADGNKTEKQPAEYFDSKQAPIEALAGTVINYALAIMGSIAVILIIIAGFMLMTAQGESTQIDKGKEIIKYAIIGLVAAFLSYIIVLFVQSLFTA